jgi:hypothetical protein
VDESREVRLLMQIFPKNIVFSAEDVRFLNHNRD